MTEERIAELLELAERATATALTGAYAPVGAALREADAELEPAIRRLLLAGRTADAMKVISGCEFHWVDVGRAADGQRLAEEALGAPDAVDSIDPALRGRTMLTASETAFRQGDQTAATTWARAAIAMTEERDPVVAALAEISLARVAFRDRDAGRIERLSRAALERAGSHPRVERAAYHMLAWAAYTAGDRGGAIGWFERSLAVRQAMDDPFGVAVELSNLGDMALEAGEVKAAAESIGTAMATALELDNVYLLTALVGSAAALAAAAGDHAEALTLLAAAESAYASTSLVPDPSTREVFDATETKARESVTASRADEAAAAGRALTLHAAAKRAMDVCKGIITSPQ